MKPLRVTQDELEYFEYIFLDQSKHILKLKEHILNNTGSRVHVHFSLCHGLYRLLFIKYSLGYPILELKEILNEYFEYFFDKIPLQINHPDFKHEKIKGSIGTYQPILDVLCLGILLKIEKGILQDFKLLIDKHYGKDLFIENIWATYQKQNYVPEAKVKLLYPKSFTLINNVFALNSSDKEEAILFYADNWMKTKKSASWYGNKKISAVNGAVVHIGYWNIEGATIAYLYGINANKFQNIKYFPIDLLADSDLNV